MHRDISERVEALFEKEAYLIDVFPKTVPPKDDGRFFAVEKYLQRSRAGFESALARIVMKLYCYYDMSVVTQDTELEVPEPEQLLAVLENGYGKASGFVTLQSRADALYFAYLLSAEKDLKGSFLLHFIKSIVIIS